MNRLRSLLLPIILAALPARQASADAIDDAVQGLIERKAIAGAVTLVEHDGKIVHYSAHGEAAPGVPMKKDAVFRIYSMTKPVTAVAALMLVEKGKLELDAPAAKYLPALAAVKVIGGETPKRAITVRDLFCHTSGIIYGWGRGKVEQAYRTAGVGAAKNLAEMVEKLGGLPLAEHPGTRWHYGFSTDVLGAVIEVVAKQPLDEFFAKRIFLPLEMKDTGFFVREDQRKRFAANYGRGLRVIDDPAKSRYLRKPGLLSGGGGLVSTAEDYLKFCRMLLRGGAPLLKKKTVAEMTRNHLPEALLPIRFGAFPIPQTGFGLGVAVRIEADRPGSLGEYHWAGAASTNFGIAPKRRLIAVTMAQHMPMTPILWTTVRPLAYKLAQPKAKQTDGDTR